MCISEMIRRYTNQWGLPRLKCGHLANCLIEKDGKFICSSCVNKETKSNKSLNLDPQGLRPFRAG